MQNLLFAILILLAILSGGEIALGQKLEISTVTWKDKLFEKDVDYGSYACSKDSSRAVSKYFKDYPLRQALGVCHNNCAVNIDFPKTQLPIFESEIGGRGYIAVHILVDERGTPIYSRALNGHPIIKQIIEMRGCNATFLAASGKRQTVIRVCINQDCGVPQPVIENVSSDRRVLKN